jgi:membrane protein
VILLLWVYYSAIILYFGAAFTRTLAEKYGNGIIAKEFATKTRVVEIEKE